MVEGAVYSLDSVLSERQVHHVVRRAVGHEEFTLQRCDLRPATEGLAGFLGDHIRATLHVRDHGATTNILLFIKSVPISNKPKADFINENNFFRREVLMYKILEDIKDPNESDESRWCPKAYLYTDSIVVMPDLAAEGYSLHHHLEYFDLPHVLRALQAIARFHSSVTNYETKKTIELNRPYSTGQGYKEMLGEVQFCDCPWLRTSVKLTISLLKAFSAKPLPNILDVEDKLLKLVLKTCATMSEKQNTLNVLLHKDLWGNNILFKYESGVPLKALLVDFQCLRYGPPAFDVVAFLYLNTSASFREQHESSMLEFYYKQFCENLSEDSKYRLKDLGYDRLSFLEWCEYSRGFAIYHAIGLFPYTLMDPQTAQEAFDNPDTFHKYTYDDRSEPVIAHARTSQLYRERQLSVCEEFMERYAMNLI